MTNHINEVIALSYDADAKMAQSAEFMPLFNLATSIHFTTKAVLYIFENQDWHDPEIYAKLDARLSFLCSLPMEDYGYLRVEPGEDPYYAGDTQLYGLEATNVEST